jgi:hypothetical protein
MEIASDWYSYGYASGMEAERKWGAEASAALSAQPQPEAVEAEEVGWTGKKCPDCGGVGQVYCEATDNDDACPSCGGTGDEYDPSPKVAPPLAPDARMRRVLERIRDDGPDHGVRWCRNIASEALRADEGKESEGSPANPDQGLASQHEYPDESRSGLNSSRNQSAPSDPTPAEQREAIAQWLFERFMQGHAQWCEMSDPNKDDWRKDADAILALSTRAGG